MITMNQAQQPIVAIVGRPNVGKSTLYNRLIGKRVAIESATPGTTRDRLLREIIWRGKKFLLMDTAGLIESKDELVATSVESARLAIDTADLILFVVDFKEGLADADFEIAKTLHKSGKNVLLVVNKSDSSFADDLKDRFKRLGFDKIHLVSAISGKNTGDLLDVIVKEIDIINRLPRSAKPSLAITDNREIKLSIIGRPNVGKSTLLNSLVGENKMIVSEMPHTTRDAQDFVIDFKNKKIRIVDTAGLRKRGKVVHDTIESFAYLRSQRAITDSKVVLYLIDTEQGLSNLDQSTIGDAINQGKSIILAVNKFDLWQEDAERKMRQMLGTLQNELSFAPWLPVIFISAKDKKHLNNLLNQVIKIYTERKKIVDEDDLEQIFTDAKEKHLNIHYFKSLKFEKADPPVFKLATFKNKKPHFSDLRYLENKIRDIYPYYGTPIFIDHKNI